MGVPRGERPELGCWLGVKKQASGKFLARLPR
jgi:hypothetical protein